VYKAARDCLGGSAVRLGLSPESRLDQLYRRRLFPVRGQDLADGEDRVSQAGIMSRKTRRAIALTALSLLADI